MSDKLKLLIAALALCIAPAFAHEHDALSSMPTSLHLGSVSFTISCKPQVKTKFNRGVALLHSFWLDEAERVFNDVASVDPDCAMAYWGVAMSHANQVNGGPARSDLMPANQALAKADAAHEKEPREAAYIRALHLLFDGYDANDFYTFAQRYSDAMAEVAKKYPDDLEAQIFYALALINSEPPDDVTLGNSHRAVAILNPIFRAHPDHPGIAHYITHASDNPSMAQDGLDAARRYALIAPAAPHALHMPSHIFARLGLWQDDIRSNLASKAATENLKNRAGPQNRLHAMEFLEYAYLQLGEINEARAIVEEAKAIKQSDLDPRYSDYYSTVETRYLFLFAIETQDWKSAAEIEPVATQARSAQGLALLAHAIAAGHLHDIQAAEKAERAIDAFVLEIPESHRSTATLLDEVRAWTYFARGDVQEAVALLRPIAERQDQIGKGEVELPAREMLAEMLFLNGQLHEALHEYQASLKSDPNRFNALLGAGEAAEKLSESALATRYYRVLLANGAGSNGVARKRLDHARTLVSSSRHGTQ